MAREVILSVWCDLCQEDGTTTPAEEMPPIAIGKAEPLVLAVCEQHKADWFDPFTETLARVGVKAAKLDGPTPGADAARVPCPYEGCGQKLKNRSSLASHMRQQHGTNLRAYLAEHEDGEPDEGAPAVTEARCDHCDKVYAWPGTRRPKVALGVHKAKTHGIHGEAHRKKAAAF